MKKILECSKRDILMAKIGIVNDEDSCGWYYENRYCEWWKYSMFSNVAICKKDILLDKKAEDQNNFVHSVP